jgi:hypothetical protein
MFIVDKTDFKLPNDATRKNSLKKRKPTSNFGSLISKRTSSASFHVIKHGTKTTEWITIIRAAGRPASNDTCAVSGEYTLTPVENGPRVWIPLKTHTYACGCGVLCTETLRWSTSGPRPRTKYLQSDAYTWAAVPPCKKVLNPACRGTNWCSAEYQLSLHISNRHNLQLTRHWVNDPRLKSNQQTTQYNGQKLRLLAGVCLKSSPVRLDTRWFH